MNLTKLLDALPDKEFIHPVPGDLEIHGIAHDSRKVESGDLFVAVVGHTVDGHRYIDQAIENGAAAVLGQRRDPGCRVTVPYIVTNDSRAALATIAAAFYGFPARKLRVIGVTGTDGKTTTTTFVRAILESAGYKASMITSIGAVIDNDFYDIGVHVTTPDALEMQRYLARAVESGADYVVLETTSHALDQLRVSKCAYDVAIITNITREHLNYHSSYEAYRETKVMLFRSLLAESYFKPNVPKVSILNVDDSSFEYLRRIKADRILTYGLNNSADFNARNPQYTKNGTRFIALTPNGEISIKMSLLGEHNIYNALAAIAACYSQGVSPDAFQKGIESVKSVIARMERVDYGQDFDVFVDFAHTPNALKRILRLARRLTTGRVILVFGLSGGPRDKTKRPIMGRIAGELADKIVITSVDWYEDEDVGTIMSQIAEGCKKVNRKEGIDYWCVRDRKEGIELGIGLAKPGDTVIVAGKGHENSIHYKTVEYPWSEFEAVRETLETKLGTSLKPLERTA